MFYLLFSIKICFIIIFLVFIFNLLIKLIKYIKIYLFVNYGLKE